MQIVTEGRKSELIETPLFSWCVTGGLGVLGLIGCVWMAAMLPTVAELKRVVLVPVMYAAGLTALVGIIVTLFTPAVILSLDPSRGLVSRRRRYIFGAETSPVGLTDLVGLESERVDGDGPEAYWVYLVFSSGKRQKLRPAALDPDLLRKVASLFAQTLRSGGRGGMGGSRPRGFGRAV